ncbi:MAG: hypothetical protein LBL07_03540 [Tannerella sp.]|nr:hypothetical protein [Tannerella sp.]
MIIYGYREARLQTKTFEDGFCTACGQKGTLTATVFSRHAHIMWVPLFPFYKRMVIRCQHCGKEFQLKETPEILHSRLYEFKKSQKPPFWQWVGLLLFIVFIFNIILSVQLDNKKRESFYKSPQLNDVYCLKYDEGYSLMYIDEIRDDSVFFITNDYVAEKHSNAKKLHRPDFYDADTYYGYSREKLDEYYYDRKIIKDIWRNLPYNSEYTEDDEPLTTDDGDESYEDEEEEEEENDPTNG